MKPGESYLYEPPNFGNLQQSTNIRMELARNFDLIKIAVAEFPDQNIVSGKRYGQWRSYKPAAYQDVINHFGYGLIRNGFEAGEKAAIISFNCPEWNITDFAVSQTGGVTVPLYPTLSQQDLEYILKDAGVKLVFAQNPQLGRRIRAASPEIPVYVFENEDETFPSWEVFVNKGREMPAEAILQARMDSVKPDDLMTLIYTSGTTAAPKGVMLSHRNILSNVTACAEVFPMFRGKTVLSFLPLCHIFERMVCYLYHYLGASVYYAESMDTIAENLREVKPYAFTTVPRLLEKVYDRIVAKGEELKGVKRKLFFWALKLGHAFELNQSRGWWYNFQLRLADRLIFSKWREALGGNVEIIVSGAAALQPRLAKVFTAAGVSVLEGYGLTETSPVIAVNRAETEGRRFGTVGPVISNVQVKIAKDGEILCKGPNVMMGYHNKPEVTAEVIKDGWLHTGDIGELSPDGFLKITDRKKEVFKTSGGKYVAPQPMENKFKESIFIEQIMVLGENRKFPAALIVPAFEALKKWCENEGIPYSSPEAAVGHPSVIQLFHSEVDRINPHFGKWEQVKKFALLPKEFSIESGELTPTLKLRRKVIGERYEDLIEQMYA